MAGNSILPGRQVISRRGGGYQTRRLFTQLAGHTCVQEKDHYALLLHGLHEDRAEGGSNASAALSEVFGRAGGRPKTKKEREREDGKCG